LPAIGAVASTPFQIAATAPMAGKVT